MRTHRLHDFGRVDARRSLATALTPRLGAPFGGAVFSRGGWARGRQTSLQSCGGQGLDLLQSPRSAAADDWQLRRGGACTRKRSILCPVLFLCFEQVIEVACIIHRLLGFDSWGLVLELLALRVEPIKQLFAFHVDAIGKPLQKGRLVADLQLAGMNQQGDFLLVLVAHDGGIPLRGKEAGSELVVLSMDEPLVLYGFGHEGGVGFGAGLTVGLEHEEVLDYFDALLVEPVREDLLVVVLAEHGQFYSAFTNNRPTQSTQPAWTQKRLPQSQPRSRLNLVLCRDCWFDYNQICHIILFSSAMKENLVNFKYQMLMKNLEKQRASLQASHPAKQNQRQERHTTKTSAFDIRSHYKMLKQSHPLYAGLCSQPESEIKKTYISDPQQVAKPAPSAQKQVTPKSYGKEKLTSFKRGQGVDFTQLHEKIKTIGS